MSNKQTAIAKDAIRETGRLHQPSHAVFKAILSEDIDWKPFAAFPTPVRLAVIVGERSKPGPYVIRVRVPHGVKLMPHKHPEDRIYTVISGVFKARTKAEELREVRLKWLEQSGHQRFTMALLNPKRVRIPIAAGENSSTLMDFDRLLAAKAVDFVQPSVAEMGGISELREIFPEQQSATLQWCHTVSTTAPACWLLSTQRLR